ncbi:MAG: serine/threonine protein kinase [Myxococcales bacterium]|nr:serine/threonine protein kinase [Myxococcales bacterium]MCB9716881.1 serine/threonine protein kinase [Myxococcales bacterium]
MGHGMSTRSSQGPSRSHPATGAHEPYERPGGRIGRFVVVSRLGEGAMGAVYLVYDPGLDRRVALKVLRRRSRSKRASKERQLRLRREAQAMAQLNHPNVVTVHDVGVAEGRVFLAMDYVEGQTLRQWLESRRRSWNEVLRTFIAAAQGLAAAHEAGVIHRDFKPENVLVGDDGSVKVMDFGLARPGGQGERSSGVTDTREAAGDGPSERAPTAAAPAVSVPPIEEEPSPREWWKGESGLISVEAPPELTRSGDVLGTPSYMAPELFDGGEASTITDQFALCVALYEGLYGVRPFAGESMAALAFNMNRERITPPPRGARVPAWLGRLVRRGLAKDPSKRYPSVQALIDALIQGAGRRRLRRAGLVAAGVVLGAGGLSYALVPAPAPCGGGKDRMQQVWNDARADAIAEAFEATGVPYADEALQRARQRIDAYAESWVAVYTSVCEETAVHGRQSPAELDRRIACLDDRLGELDALLGVLAEADRRVAERAAQAASGLRGPGICAEGELEQRPTSDDPARQAELDGLRGRLLRAEALERAGRYDDAAMLSRQIATEAETLGEAPLRAEALIQLGVAEDMAGSYAESAEHLREAYFIANEERLDLVSARAAVALITTEGIHLARGEEGLSWARHAEAAFERSDPENALRGRYHAALGSLHFQRFELDQARDNYEKAIAIERAALGEDHERVASLLAYLGAVQEQAGQSEDAVASFERAIEIHRRALGPDHPELAAQYNNYAVVLVGRGDLAGAQAQLEQALEIYRKSMGEHPGTALFLDNLGGLLMVRGEYERGRQLIEEGLAMRQKTLGPDHPQVANSLSNLGNAYERAGDWGAAKRSYERALAVLEKSGGPDTPQVAGALLNLGVLALREGAIQRGYDQCKRAVEIFEAAAPGSPDLGAPLLGLGWAQLELDQPQEALATLERAYELRGRGLTDELPGLVALLLARALELTGGDAARAKKLRAEARAVYAKLPHAEPPERIAGWMKEPAR